MLDFLQHMGQIDLVHIYRFLGKWDLQSVAIEPAVVTLTFYCHMLKYVPCDNLCWASLS